MNKTFKKIMALVLTVIMLLSVAVTASASYVDPDTGITVEEVQTTAPADTEEEEAHRSLIQIFIDFWVEIFDFFKYIFYDLLLGEPA